MRVWLIAIWVVLAVGLSGVAAQEDYNVDLEYGDCLFVSPDAERITCGTLTVPQDRSNPAGLRVTIPFAILAASDWFPRADPVIYLNGGPGAETLAAYGPNFPYIFAPYSANRDVILFDYRGVGYATPSLDCPELDDLWQNLSDDQLDYMTLQADCRQRLLDTGVDFDRYDSATMAQDIADLWTALGYEQVNLLGLSYGSRMALTLMRDHPENIRSAVLDGVLPLQVDQWATTGSRYTDALELLYDACAKDPACRAAYPDLDVTTAKLIEQLEKTPVELTITPKFSEFSDLSYPAEINGAALVGLIFDAMYSSWRVSRLPRMLDAASRGDYRLLNYEFNLTGIQNEGYSEGLRVAIDCNEELPFTEVTDNLLNTIAEFLFAQNTNPCAEWVSAPPDSIENEPVSSEIPALVVTGQFDPVTPPAWSDMAAATLPNSYVYTFPGLGHTVSLDDSSACAQGIVQAFLDEPDRAPDAACINDLQASFDTPVTAVTLTDYGEYGLAGVRPADWLDQGDMFVSSKAYYTSFQYTYSDSVAGSAYLDWVRTTFGVEAEGQTRSLSLGGYDWQVYRFNATQYTSYVTVAVTPLFDDWHVIVLLTSASADEHKLLYDELFLPALEAFYYD